MGLPWEFCGTLRVNCNLYFNVFIYIFYIINVVYILIIYFTLIKIKNI